MMTTVIGDLLNWAAAGVLFPLMLAPLAVLFGARGRAGAAVMALRSGLGSISGAPITTKTPRLRNA
ncbi:MAG: hypothetical protein AAGC77_03215, partial [Pseudomonadota bacterium]